MNANESYGASSDGNNSILEVFTTPTPNATNNQTSLSNDDLNSANVIVYPNPVSDGILNINDSFEGSSLEVIVFDIPGKQLTTKLINSNAIDVSYLNSGYYIIKIIQGSKTYIKKFIVE